MISFRYDAPEYDARTVAGLLAETAGRREIVQDAYSLGGEVEAFEAEAARALGKERAVFMPTGTLANHLALRALARRNRAAAGSRIVVQERSHVYQDMGDALSVLSGYSLVPLGHGRPEYTLAEVRAALEEARDTRVRTGIGALSVECPVRRCHGAVFGFGEMRRIAEWARDAGIGTHLDGARLFIASHYTGVPVREYAACFDTVYVSLYKYFGSPSGAVLAGPADLLDGMYHDRRMFGGGLNQAWMFAAIALEGLRTFDGQFAGAVSVSEALVGLLAGRPEFLVRRIEAGTNIFVLALADGGREQARRAGFEAGLRSRGVLVPAAVEGEYFLKVNTGLAGEDPERIAGAFVRAVRER